MGARLGEGLRRLGASLSSPSPERRALDRLAWVHATGALGDALVAVSLAGTLFFSVPVAAARPRVVLYLLITVAPFAVVAPLLGRLLDGRGGASRVALAAALLLRAVLAWQAATRLDSLLLYPLAFGLLVCSRAHGISRSALTPELAGPGRELVPINSRMAKVAAVGGTLGALLGVGVHRLFGGGQVLRVSGVVFLLGVSLALAIPPLQREAAEAGPGPGPGPEEPQPAGAAARLGAAGRLGAAARLGAVGRLGAAARRPSSRVRLARAASAGTRAAGGFAMFLLAFALRRRGVGTAGLGLLLAGVGAGSVAGAFVVPRIGRRLKEEGLLALGLGVSAATAVLLFGRVGVVTAGLAGVLMGGAAAAARLGFESLVQREVPLAVRGSTITRSETVFQLSWVGGAVVPVALPLPANPTLLALGVVCGAATAVYLTGLWRLRALPGAAVRSDP